MQETKLYKGKRLVVLGGGESGAGAAILGAKAGMKVLLSDKGELKKQYRDMLESRGIPFEQHGHTEDEVLKADIVVKSPGIPDTAPLVKALRQKGIPVISEIEFAGNFTDSKMICITGSNGKTTTTSLIYHIIRSAGVDAGLAGNIGHSLALQVAENPKPVYVIELSSFQLDGMYDFKADIAVLLNITPDHLDRYDYKMQNYVESKFRIMQNQTDTDFFIYWKGDPVVSSNLANKPSKAIRLPFDSDLKIAVPGREPFEIDRNRIPIKGLHNVYNTMAAALACSAFGLSPKQIADGIETFSPVPHRLEPVGEIGGVKWINDSKATNVASTYYALESMTTPTVLILGGTDKGNDYNEILPFVKEKVKAIVCMGADNTKLMNFFADKVPALYDCHTLDEAVERCSEVSEPGDTVLLSPCCASFDLFKNYEDRGDRFRLAVAELNSLSK